MKSRDSLLGLFWKTINNIWPMLLIVSVVLVSIRLTYLLYNKKRIEFHKELLMFFFIIYVILLYYIVTFQDNNYGTNNFIPFKEMLRYDISSSLFIKNVIGNIILFVPLGIFVTLYIKNKSFLITFILSLIISCSIEFVQSIIGRTVDIDDVILNTFGGLLGYLMYKVGSKFTCKLPKFMKKPLFLDILSLLFVLVIIYIIFKFEFWRYLS